MARLYHPSFLNNAKSFLHIPIQGDVDSNYLGMGDKDWDEHYFQILIFEFPNDTNHEPKLVCGKKKDLQKYYFKTNPKEFSAPTEGVEVNGKFVEKSEPEFPTIRFLLQSRKLSQLLAYTWIKRNDPDISESKKLQTKLVRSILNNYNLLPKTINTTFIEGETETIILDDIQLKEKLLKIEKEYQKKLEEYQNSPAQFDEIPPLKLDSFLIKPESRSYNSIQLALLSSGNAYYREDGKLIRIAQPIFSNYEIVWENVFEISWNTFYSSQEDISQSGLNPKPPYHTLIIGYPPRPSKFTLDQKTIKDWATAEDEFEGKRGVSKYPFYPREYNDDRREITSEWENKKLDYVVPPHPYIPVTCG